MQARKLLYLIPAWLLTYLVFWLLDSIMFAIELLSKPVIDVEKNLGKQIRAIWRRLKMELKKTLKMRFQSK